MKSTSTMIKDNGQFIETGTIKINGKQFTSGGAWMAKNLKTGKYEGILYASPESNEVTSWDGKLRIKAKFGQIFNSNWRDNKRQFIWFTYNGMKFVGINYSVGWRQDIFVKQIK